MPIPEAFHLTSFLGGTSKAIQNASIPVKDVADITKAPEMLGGRVKTLHPAVHGGILAQNSARDDEDMKNRGYEKIDLVACNLYPFEKTIASENVTIAQAVEEVDIGMRKLQITSNSPYVKY